MKMREFIYYSQHARTTGNFDTNDLMKAGRMDIVCHVIINSFFLSHKKREDVVLHLVFAGSPDPVKHLIIFPEKYLPETGVEVGSLDLSKKDIAGFIKKMLYKYKQGKKTEVFKGCFIEKKNLFKLIEELQNEEKTVYILDRKGIDIHEIAKEKLDNAVFLLGDHEGVPKRELKRLKKQIELVSLGKETYLASQAITILNAELDRRMYS